MSSVPEPPHWHLEPYRYRPGCKRYLCHSCKRTFNELTATLWHQSQRPLAYWILATFLLCLACSSQRIARQVGVHIQTGYRWWWWLPCPMSCIAKLILQTALEPAIAGRANKGEFVKCFDHFNLLQTAIIERGWL